MGARATFREIDPAAVGLRIKEARIAAGMSQRQLSFPGCSAAYISRLEAGDRSPSGHLLDELASRLGKTRVWLETGVDAVVVVLDPNVAADCAAYIADGLQIEWEKRFAESDGGGGLSPVEYALLPAIRHLLDENGREIAGQLLDGEAAWMPT
jgi:transcriptional regulator with XRE-family HTH domain